LSIYNKNNFPLHPNKIKFKIENKTLHHEINKHKMSIYNIYKHSLEFEHSKIIEDKEIISTISKLLKENEYLRKLISNSETCLAEKDFTGLLDKILKNPEATVNQQNYEEKIDALLLLKNKKKLFRDKSETETRIKRLKLNNAFSHFDEEYTTDTELVCEIEAESGGGRINFYNMQSESSIKNEDEEEKEIKTLKNLANLADMCSINCDFFDKKLILKSSRNIGKEGKGNKEAISLPPTIDIKNSKRTNNVVAFNKKEDIFISPTINNIKNINNQPLPLLHDIQHTNVNKILENNAPEGKKTKSRNDNNKNKLVENPNVFKNAELLNIKLNADIDENNCFDAAYLKASKELIKIEDQQENESEKDECADMDITIIDVCKDGKDAKYFSFDKGDEKGKFRNYENFYFDKEYAEEGENENDLLEIRITNGTNNINNIIINNEVDQHSSNFNINSFSQFVDSKNEKLNNEKEDEEIYAFKNEFANKLSNMPKSNRKMGSMDSSFIAANRVEKAQQHSLSKIMLNEKKHKFQFPTNSNSDDKSNNNNKNNENSLVKTPQPQQKLEISTNEKNETTNFTTDINTNSNPNFININKIHNNCDSGLFLLSKKLIEGKEKEEEILDEKSFRENLVPIVITKNSELNIDKNITFKVITPGKQNIYLFSSTPRDISSNKDNKNNDINN